MYKNETIEKLQAILLRNGFVRCDIMNCNCGSWHARYGLRERFDEIKDLLEEAGHPVCNKNGNKAYNALKSLIAERDELKKGYKTKISNQSKGTV